MRIATTVLLISASTAPVSSASISALALRDHRKRGCIRKICTQSAALVVRVVTSTLGGIASATSASTTSITLLTSRGSRRWGRMGRTRNCSMRSSVNRTKNMTGSTTSVIALTTPMSSRDWMTKKVMRKGSNDGRTTSKDATRTPSHGVTATNLTLSTLTGHGKRVLD